MNKKIIISLATISAVAAMAVGGTIAYFSDTQQITGNTFTAGTMNLRIDKDPNPDYYNWSTSFNSPISFTGLYPGYDNNNERYGGQIIDIMNVGGIDGNATLALTGTSVWNELASVLQFHIYYDGNHDGIFDETGISGTINQFNGTYTLGKITGTDVPGGKVASIKIAWSVPASAGNGIQGQSLTINGTFGVEQVH